MVFVGGCSEYIYVDTFPLKLSQVLGLFTKQRIFLKIIGEQKPLHFSMHQLTMPMLLTEY